MADTDPAVTAAAEAIRAAIRSDEDYAGGPTALSRVAVAAARPIIEAEVRERIVADLLAWWECDHPLIERIALGQA